MPGPAQAQAQGESTPTVSIKEDVLPERIARDDSFRITSVADAIRVRDTLSSQQAIELDKKYNAQNYHCIPFVATRGEGIYLIDRDGKKHYDFLACYGAANQGHNHPSILKAVQEQAARLALSSRAFYSDMLAIYAKFITEFFGYQRVLPMNSGVEAVETAIKLCRKWAYLKKGVPEPQAKILMAERNFWGRTITACSTSSDPQCSANYGPYTPGFALIPYNNVDALKAELEKDPNICAFVVEPIQGEAGVFVPDEGYLKKVSDLCKKHNVLLVADEIQSGLCRTGKMLCCDHDNVRPDILVLGKALSGGVYPVSSVLCDDDIMLTIRPGQHGSTYGGNPLGCMAAIAACCVLKDENLADNATKMGVLFRDEMSKLKAELPWVANVRGKGLMNAIQINEGTKHKAWDICVELANNGVLCKPTHDVTIRFTPPLVITEAQMRDAVDIIAKVFKSFDGKM